MGDGNNAILIKSEKASQKAKKLIIWGITALLLVVMITAFVLEYNSYKEGQEFGLGAMAVTSGLSGTNLIDTDGSYEEQCEDAYRKLNSRTSDFYYNGYRIDGSEVREAESRMRSAFHEVMLAGGYDRYSSYNIADWFKYPNMTEYFIEYYWEQVLPICCYAAVLLAIIFTIFIGHEEKKELIVYEESVLCKVNRKKSKQVVFKDINSVNFGNKTLKISGIGIKFKIANVINAETIKSVIIEKKNAALNKTETANVSGADELLKYKELLDSGVITQEEFVAKKNQILGL